MGVPTLEVGYTSATTGKGDHEVHKGHVVALEKKDIHNYNFDCCFVWVWNLVAVIEGGT
jgi:hypothetical protein